MPRLRTFLGVPLLLGAFAVSGYVGFRYSEPATDEKAFPLGEAPGPLTYEPPARHSPRQSEALAAAIRGEIRSVERTIRDLGLRIDSYRDRYKREWEKSETGHALLTRMNEANLRLHELRSGGAGEEGVARAEEELAAARGAHDATFEKDLGARQAYQALEREMRAKVDRLAGLRQRLNTEAGGDAAPIPPPEKATRAVRPRMT